MSSFAEAERKQRYWQDVESDEDIAGFSLEINATRVVLQVSGSQDFYRAHHDREFARSCGLREVFVNTRFLQAALGRVVSDWMGPAGQLSRFKMEMRRMVTQGDTITCRGKVTGKYVKDDKHCVECDLWVENQQEITTIARAVVTLPVREDW